MLLDSVGNVAKNFKKENIIEGPIILCNTIVQHGYRLWFELHIICIVGFKLKIEECIQSRCGRQDTT